MTLSGYLFAKLLDNREVLWLPYIESPLLALRVRYLRPRT